MYISAKIRFLFLSLFFILCFTTKVSSKEQHQDIIRLYADFNVPSLKIDDITASVSSNKKFTHKLNYGINLQYNSIRFSIASFYKGYRYTGSFHFMKDSAVSPYLGLSYIYGSKAKYFMGQIEEYKLDHPDFIIGLSANILDFIHPFVEYEVVSSLFVVGLRFSITYTINKS